MVYMDTVNICSGQCGVHVIQSTYVVGNVVYMDTVNICSGQCGVDTVNTWSGSVVYMDTYQHM